LYILHHISLFFSEGSHSKVCPSDKVLIFLLPLSTARGRLRAEKKKRIKSHLFQIIFLESGIKAYIDILYCLSVSECPEQLH
jgi:hypothetical protein